MSGVATGGVARLRRVAATLSVCTLLAACSDAPVRTEAPRSRSVRAPMVSRAKPGAMERVARGDTLYAIATRNGISALDLAAWNQLAPPYTVYPGQRLRLYPGARRSEASGAARRPRVATPTHPASREATATAAAPPASGFAWRWPASGAVIERFQAGEPTRQGIDIGGDAGDSVRAAADGRVVYSGAGLVGYGELVIIKHSDTWLSAYGHNRKRLVVEGQQVKAGEPIAEMGHSGAPRDMLHFEIRYNGKPVDPQGYLPAR